MLMLPLETGLHNPRVFPLHRIPISSLHVLHSLLLGLSRLLKAHHRHLSDIPIALVLREAARCDVGSAANVGREVACLALSITRSELRTARV